ncbi:putative histone-lysine N-methyltransferase chromatin remodeling SET family [Helianthus annuus]|uniref:Histone-lysine N-methyltransferase chromatin remodeling SET family n=1 Tax=Helianthus annuus TaxID=4232 RepID=A0A251SQD6_HELAN|nr:histone-lysine N-methyltransferase ATXR4 isoform X1 [Helianthus annuus]KAF5772810.1 putative histone-lysine N-methyltransferase chromatin remodeling SET family [Helianthus annuus]KAJ0480567.1 putative [histone H3]-lysine(4) N-trimethyltransferase chromatin remodeling SET family [Helianthus annuus]KAJ0497211.1 putative [histone H3]-lysine(4) N-trimethyltransferase chromatin remodeling SET family [Helianthus annuus]KAJ0670734.1 putative [histone H3]-lysine(4) N-trimethyltransferase chromatin r
MLPLLSRRLAQRFFPHSNRLLTTYFFSTTSDHRGSNPSRPSPPPIQVLLTESAGRGVFATRSIEPGELIHTAKPFVSHPSISSIDKVCYFCLKNSVRRLGFQAPEVLFCSEECREQAKGFYEVEKEADWSAFVAHCRNRGLKYPFLAKRLACMVISGVTSEDSLDILQPARLSAEMISQMEEELCLLRGALEDSGVKDEQLTFLNIEWYAGVLARIRINAFRIELAGTSYDDLLALAAASVESEAAVGNAVYLLPSFYNHDCDPNTHIVWVENVEARLKALREIEAGEELRICYIDASMDRDARQNLLSNGFGFECNCPRCMSND